MNTTNDIQELLLQAMDIIANSAIKEDKKDSDITLWTCKIVDDTNRKSGEYKVTDDNVTFYAYSQYTEYKKDEHVAVVIPKGDFNNTKYIVQKVSADGTQLPYASPLDNYVQITEDLITNFKTKSLTVNNKDQEVARIQLTNSYAAQTPKGRALYDALIFNCEFQTSLSSFPNVKGNYGIKIILKYINELNYPLEETLTFDSSEFLGNVFNFAIPSVQKKAFTLSKTDVLQEIQVRFYQNLKFGDKKPNSIIPIVELEKLSIHFGSDISKIEDNTLEIYSLDGLNFYGDSGARAAENKKRIGLMWYNKDASGNYVGFSDGIYNFKDENGNNAIYDEEKYLSLKETNASLNEEAKKENAPKKENGLRAAAALTAIESANSKALKCLDNIMTTTGSLEVEMRGVFGKIETGQFETDAEGNTKPIMLDAFTEKISNKEGSKTAGYLANFYATLETQMSTFVSDYRKELRSSIAVNTAYPFAKMLELDSYLISPLDSGKSYSIFLGEVTSEKIKSSYGGYFSVYNSYVQKIDKYRTEFFNQKTKLESLVNELETYFPKRNEGDKDYEIEFDETKYENRYCVYWYEYEQGYEGTEYDKKIAGSSWKKLTNLTNFWNPGVGKSVESVVYNKAIKNGTFDYTISPYSSEKKLMAILFHNHNEYKSEPMVFKKTAADGTIMDDNGVFEITHGTNSKESYQCYGEDSYLISSSDARRERLLLPKFTSSLGKSISDFVGGQIYWYLPQDMTMLNCDTESDVIKTYAVSSSLDTANPKYYIPGYTCFTKSIENILEGEGESQIERPPTSNDLSFGYLINSYYSNTLSNNIIRCKLVKGSWEYDTAISFAFSSYGTSGTDYTLAFSIPTGGRAAVTRSEGMVLYLKLFNYNNEEIPLYKSKPTDSNAAADVYGYGVTFSFLNSGAPTIVVGQNGHSMKCTLTTSKSTEGAEEPCYGVLKATATIYNKDKNDEANGIKLVTFYSVPYSISPSNSKNYIDGATTITYSSMGTEPKYYKDPYKLYDGSTKQEIQGIKWSILNTDIDGFPKVDTAKKLIVKDSYTQDMENTISVAYGTDGTTSWYQPIFIQQNQHEFKLLNDWNGKMKISEDEGYILSNMLVAGEKDSNNKFTGVVMGETAKLIGTDNQTGLFGFHEGARSFGFKTDGTAFLGKSGHGRIEFNGNNGTITSSGYNLEDEGNKDIGSGVFLDLDAPIFAIKKIGKKVMEVDYSPLKTGGNKKTFYLESYNFAEPDLTSTDEEKKKGSGFKLDLEKNTLKAYNGLTIKTSEFDLSSSEGNFALQMNKDNFLLKADDDHYISSSSKGIKWGSYFVVNETDFQIGNKNSNYISGNENGFSFNFSDGQYLTFTSETGLTSADNNVTIQKGTQRLKSTDFSDEKKKGMEINLQTGAIKAYDGLGIIAKTFNLESTSGTFALKMTDSDFLLQADSTHYINKDPAKGILWGDYLLVNHNQFRIGNVNGTYIKSQTKITEDGKTEEQLVFRFATGEHLTLSTDEGLKHANGTINISSGDEILQSVNFQAPGVNEDGTVRKGTGMRINLNANANPETHKGVGLIEAYSGLLIKADDNNYIKLDNGEIQIKAQNFNLTTSSTNAFISTIQYNQGTLTVKNGAGTPLSVSDVQYTPSSNTCTFKLNGYEGKIVGIGNKKGNYEFFYNSQTIASGVVSKQTFNSYTIKGTFHVSEEDFWEDIPLEVIFTPNGDKGTTSIKLRNNSVYGLTTYASRIDEAGTYEIDCQIGGSSWLVIRVETNLPYNADCYNNLSKDIRISTDKESYNCTTTQFIEGIKVSCNTLNSWESIISSIDTNIILSSNAALCPLQLGEKFKLYWNGAAEFSSLIISGSADSSKVVFQLNQNDQYHQGNLILKKLSANEVYAEDKYKFLDGAVLSMDQCVIEDVLIAETIYLGKSSRGKLRGSGFYPRQKDGILKIHDGKDKTRMIVENNSVRFINNKNANIMRININDNSGDNVYFNITTADGKKNEVSAQSLYDSTVNIPSLQGQISTLLEKNYYSKITLKDQSYVSLTKSGNYLIKTLHNKEVAITGISLGENNKIIIGYCYKNGIDNLSLENHDIFFKHNDTYYGIIEWLMVDFGKVPPWLR